MKETSLEERDTGRSSTSTRLKITSALVGGGAVCGAVAGAALTYLGNVISGYPIPPTVGVYATNAGLFAGLGAILGPPLVWSMLRTVPLWRALAEPAAAALVVGVLTMVLAPSLFVAAVPAAALGAALRLRWAFGNAESASLLRGENDRAPADASSGDVEQVL
jgi:MFS family permease